MGTNDTKERKQRFFIEVEVVVLPGKVVLENKGQQSLQVKLFDDSSHEQQLWLEPSQIKSWTYKEEKR